MPRRISGKLPNTRHAVSGTNHQQIIKSSAKSLKNNRFYRTRDATLSGRSAALSPAMKHTTTHESLESTPQTRVPACTLEEARRLLAELKAEYDSLSPDERRAVREALADAAAEAALGQPAASVSRSMISISSAKAYWWHVRSGLLRAALLVLNFICDPIAVLPAIVAGLWKPTQRGSENHAAN